MKQNRKIYPMLFAVSFMAWLLLPFIMGNIIGSPKPKITSEDIRNTASRPVFNINRLDPFPENFNKFYYDHFPFRETLLAWWSANVGVPALKKAPVKSLVDKGDDGWLYPAEERPVFEGTQMLSNENLELIHQTIRNRVIFYRAQGIRFYVFIVPMKSVVYPEFLPSYYYHYKDTTQTQKLVALLKQDTLIPFTDVNPALVNAKPKGNLYTHTDKSWNSMGAFEAYSQIISRIRKDFPSVKPVEAKDVTFGEFKTPGGMLASRLGIQKEVGETRYRPVIKNARAMEGKKAGHVPPPWFELPAEFEKVSVVPDSSLPKALVIRDPQIEPMMPFLDQNFKKTVYIFDAWMYDLNWDIIQKEKPGIVILEVSEPNIKNIIHL